MSFNHDPRRGPRRPVVMKPHRSFDIWFAIFAVMGTAWFGFICWAIYSVVIWVTSK